MVCKEEQSRTEIAFAKVFERVAVKYAEYVEAKLIFFIKAKEIKPGQEVFFGESEKGAEQLMFEMQTLTQIAETLAKTESSLS